MNLTQIIPARNAVQGKYFHMIFNSTPQKNMVFLNFLGAPIESDGHWHKFSSKLPFYQHVPECSFNNTGCTNIKCEK